MGRGSGVEETGWGGGRGGGGGAEVKVPGCVTRQASQQHWQFMPMCKTPSRTRGRFGTQWGGGVGGELGETNSLQGRVGAPGEQVHH